MDEVHVAATGMNLMNPFLPESARVSPDLFLQALVGTPKSEADAPTNWCILWFQLPLCSFLFSGEGNDYVVASDMWRNPASGPLLAINKSSDPEKPIRMHKTQVHCMLRQRVFAWPVSALPKPTHAMRPCPF